MITIALLGSAFALAACQHSAPTPTKKPHGKQSAMGQQPVVVAPKATTPLPTFKPIQRPIKTVPASFVTWLSQGDNRQQAQEYYQYLLQNHVANIVPMSELLRTARSWQECGRSEYAVPSRELWQNSISTLKVFNYLVSMNILTDFEVTSVYRDVPLNECAGGAKSSKHIFNAAIDFRLGSEYPSIEEIHQIEQTKNKLCHFWIQHGAALDMGLGVYRSGQIHIDTQGFRTWGPDLTKVSSPCYFLLPPSV
ncbi:MAG: D-Ala-D-Ala carboxypeptidase family metallohydrolase [Acinetobacter sp.]|nr:D-Ala-D-Ala carboxypeptidase family metallohydrolase [Acinetobacter sp.]